MPDDGGYGENLRKLRSILIFEALQKRKDEESFQYIKDFSEDINWQIDELCIDEEAWNKITDKMIDPKYAFCHPDILLYNPKTSIYYRGSCTLSIKSTKDYVGAIENLEKGNIRARFDKEKALKMAQTYNKFISFIIRNTDNWTLGDSGRSVIATMGITLDGTYRNKVGQLAEDRIRNLIVQRLSEKKLIERIISEDEYVLAKDILMRFAPEPDVSFIHGGTLLAVVEIKGGIDTAGALERYGAAKKSFEEAVKQNSHCDTYYLSAAITTTLTDRVNVDRLVNQMYNLVDILSDSNIESKFFTELFHHSLRII